MTKEYVNLHNHTVYSLLDGYSKLEEYCDRAKKLGQLGVCQTDHGNIFGSLNMYEAATAAGLKPFLGEEFYQARKSRFDQDPEERASSRGSEWEQKGPYHAGLIAYNNQGFHNLIKISSRAFTEGYYVKPRIDHELIAAHNDGLVMLSGCLSGELSQAILRGDDKFALETAAKMQAIMGKENYFIEVMRHGIEEEEIVLPKLIEIANMIGAPIVATCDSHYTEKAHADQHDTMICVNTASLKSQEDRFKFSSDNFYLKSYNEMAQLFPAEYLDNTLLIYEKHDLKLDFTGTHFPIFPVPDGTPAEEYLERKLHEGLIKRFGIDWKADKEIYERILYEMDVIKSMGFANYFLVVADIINWAKDNDILIGFGRGSVAGCLVAYAVGITEVNPLEHGLIFERFLVPGRLSMPDVDIDIDDRYREEVIEYTRHKYGYDHTAQIVTFGTMRAKKAVRDAARVLGKEYILGDQIAKAMPPALFGVPKDLNECMQSQEFNQLYNTNPEAKEVIDAAFKLEGLIRDTGIHAAGLVIADKPITDYIPVMQYGPDKPVVTQWEMSRIDQLGLLKIDFLGLRNLSIVDICVKNIKERRGLDINLYDIPKNLDEKTFDALSDGDNVSGFQIESAGIKDLLFGVKPRNLNDIAAILALYRPGPMGSNVHNEFINRKNKKKSVAYLHSSLKPYIENTYGLLLYQEQLLALAQGAAGFSIGDADSLRKAVGKKKMAEMKKWREAFVKGCIKTSGMSKSIADKLFSEIEHHASYSFSINHAISYALLTYATIYLKTNYPTEYMAAALSTVQEKIDRLQLYLNETKKMGITVLPPSVNKSDSQFRILSENEIAYGLSGIAGIGEAAIKGIVDNRPEHGFESIPDMLRSTNLSHLDKKSFEFLADAGALDELINDGEQIYMTRPDKMKVLLKESKRLGIYLTSHPFSEVEDLIEGKTTHTLNECYDLPAATKIRTAGIVIAIEKKMTKKGRKMFFVKIQDLDMDVQVVIPSYIADDLPDPPFGLGDILILSGRIDRYMQEDNTSFQISMAEKDYIRIPVDDIPNTRPIFLKTKNNLSLDRIQKICDIIKIHAGESDVYLEFIDDEQHQINIKFNDNADPSIIDHLKLLLEV